MVKLLIVDDEPLVQAGIKSMINWEDYGVNIVGAAANGAAAYELIERYSPEIVITDIKMPVMSGLELARKCYEEKRRLPVFIILTSYEEFQLVKEAIVYQVTDYLVKLELTPETLGEAVRRAISKADELRGGVQPKEAAAPPESLYLFREQFFTRLLFNLFESESQFMSQAENLGLDFSYKLYAAAYMEINSGKLSDMPPEKQLGLYTNSLQMTGELLPKYVNSHVLPLDMKHFAVIFFLGDDNAGECRKVIENAIGQSGAMLYKYYSVRVRASVGSFAVTPQQIASSFQDAKQIFSQTSGDGTVLFMEDADGGGLKNVFSMSLFREEIRKAYDEFDEKALYDIFTSIMELFEDRPSYFVQALDAAGNILYLSLALLSDGEQIVADVFRGHADGYRSLYSLTSVGQIVRWLGVLRDGLCKSFSDHNRDYRNHIVANVKKYISLHVEEKLTLNRVAEVFGISPNYLSVLFSKYNDVGFNDYINQSKIEASKRLLEEGKLKVYEISDKLGFESAFYFSRVFKKITGMSPRDYLNMNGGL